MEREPFLSVIGTGKWGINHVLTAAKLGVLKAVHDTNGAALNDARAKLCAVPLDTSKILLTSELSEVLESSSTAAVVATPPSTHCRVACELLRSGKDVLVEKPMGLTVDEAEKMRSLAKDLGRILMVGHLLHFTPLHRALKVSVESGVAGKVCRIHSQRKNFGTIRLGEDVVWSIGPHDVSLVLGMAKGRKVRSVSCTGQSIVTEGIADSAIITIAFDDGMQAVVEVSWLHPTKQREVMVYGAKGCLHLQEIGADIRFLPWGWERENSGPSPRVSTLLGAPESIDDVDESIPPLERELLHFMDCCISRKEPLTNGEEGCDVVRVLCAASKSLRDGGVPVVIDETPAGYFAHSLSCVDDGAVIGSGAKIWHYSHVMSGAFIGSKSSLGQNVNVGSAARIGSNVKIQNNVSIYDAVTIEDDVFLGPSCVFTNVKTPRAFVSRKDEFIPTHVKAGATIGANATIVCGVTIGTYAMVGAGAVVTRDVAPYSLVVGTPAKHVGWVGTTGHRLVDDPASGPDILSCPDTGKLYQVVKDGDSSPRVAPLVPC